MVTNKLLDKMFEILNFLLLIPRQPPYIPQRYYYNPLIPPAVQQPHQETLYTLATVGNTQVLIPCTTNSDQLIYDSTIALNIPIDQNLTPQPSLRVPTQTQPPAQSTAPQPQRTPLLPTPGIQQPLIRDQVVAAAQELSSLNALPGSAYVGANINSVPYTQGSYFYYYLIPPTGNQQVVDQHRQYYNPYANYYRLNNQYGVQGNYLPIIYGGYPGGGYPVPYIPQPSASVPVRTSQSVQQSVSQQPQGQVAQQQAQQQQVKG